MISSLKTERNSRVSSEVHFENLTINNIYLDLLISIYSGLVFDLFLTDEKIRGIFLCDFYKRRK